GLEDDEAVVLLLPVGGLAVLSGGHGGEKGHVGLAVVLQGVQMLQLKFIAVLVGDGDEIRAKFFTHIGYLPSVSSCSIVSRPGPKCKSVDSQIFHPGAFGPRND